MQADISALDRDLVAKLHVDAATGDALATGQSVSIGLWNACRRATNGDLTCSEPSISYVFDPASVWTLVAGGSADAAMVFPSALVDQLRSHSVSTVYIKILYIVALGLGLASIVLAAVHACCGRDRRRPRRVLAAIGVVFLLVATLLLLAGAGLATKAYAGLVSALGPAFGDVIRFSLGPGAVAVLWLSVIFAASASVFAVLAWRKEVKYQRVEAVGSGHRSGGGKGWQADAFTVIETGEPSSLHQPRRSHDIGDNDGLPLLERDTAYVPQVHIESHSRPASRQSFVDQHSRPASRQSFVDQNSRPASRQA